MRQVPRAAHEKCSGADGGQRFTNARYRRVTHINDPVPALPFSSLGYHHHAHEYYISAAALPYSKDNVKECVGSEDPECLAGTSFNILQALTGHRDYFHRLGVCFPPTWFLEKERAKEL